MYIVLEIQKTGEQIALLSWTFTDVQQANAQYHTVLAAAAMSSVPLHAASMLDERGNTIKSENYVHDVK